MYINRIAVETRETGPRYSMNLSEKPKTSVAHYMTREAQSVRFEKFSRICKEHPYYHNG